MNPTQQLQDQVNKLQADLANLSAEFYKTNFSANQDFPKYCSFTSRLKVPHYASLPTTFGSIGDIIEVAGILYICTATTPTYTKVGLQS